MLKGIEGGPTPPHKQVVLVVEDEPIIRFGLALHLEENGFQVIEAESAADAIAILQEPGCIVNLVFSDVRMPGELDGIGLSRWIFENRPNIAVILASGELGKATAIKDLCGAETMTKPFDYGSLTTRIRAAIIKKNPPKS
jgi:DNA-binding NtrC family response regulator